MAKEHLYTFTLIKIPQITNMHDMQIGNTPVTSYHPKYLDVNC